MTQPRMTSDNQEFPPIPEGIKKVVAYWEPKTHYMILVGKKDDVVYIFEWDGVSASFNKWFSTANVL